jgi:23S rRNA G2445 N2-methylase RlmL
MKYTYFSTFISGLGEVVTEALRKHSKDLKVRLNLDGLVVYESESPIKNIRKNMFLNNSYYLLKYLYKPQSALHDLISEAFTFVKKISIPYESIVGSRTFRIIISSENQLISIPKKKLTLLEELFAEKLDRKVDRANPDFEIWFLERSEGYAFCGIRLTKKPSTEKFLQKGELRPELSWILCFLSEPKQRDVFLDPFAGYGAIPKARREFPYTKIISSDVDPQKVEKLKQIFHDTTCEVQNWNATKLPLSEASVHAIVTDPPWGHYEEDDIEKLYNDMFAECERVLKPNGILIVLSAQKEIVKSIIREKNLQLQKEYNILVSGKKSGVYKLIKNG